MKYAEYVYEIIRNESKNLDAIYQDYILYMVGAMGMQALVENGLVESCGSVNGRLLYVLCEDQYEKFKQLNI